MDFHKRRYMKYKIKYMNTESKQQNDKAFTEIEAQFDNIKKQLGDKYVTTKFLDGEIDYLTTQLDKAIKLKESIIQPIQTIGEKIQNYFVEFKPENEKISTVLEICNKLGFSLKIIDPKGTIVVDLTDKLKIIKTEEIEGKIQEILNLWEVESNSDEELQFLQLLKNNKNISFKTLICDQLEVYLPPLLNSYYDIIKKQKEQVNTKYLEKHLSIICTLINKLQIYEQYFTESTKLEINKFKGCSDKGLAETVLDETPVDNETPIENESPVKNESKDDTEKDLDENENS
jgi:hypothetical protein